MKGRFRTSLQTGLTFGFIIFFFAITGFTATFAELLGGFLGNARQATASSLGAIINLGILLGLLGLWAGSRAARPQEDEALGQFGAIGSGLTAGVFAGLFIGVFAFIVGDVVVTQGVDLRKYLVALGPTEVELLIFGLPPLAGAIVLLALETIMGGLGGYLNYLSRERQVKTASGKLLASGRDRFLEIPVIARIAKSRRRNLIIYGLILLVLIILPLILGQYWNYTLGTVGIYVLLGLGLNIVVGLAGLLDLGYVAFFAIGAYTVGLLTAPVPLHIEWSFWAALPLGVVFAALAGVILGIPVLRMRGDYLAIVTLGFGEIIRILSRSDALTPLTGGPRGVHNIAGPSILGLDLSGDVAFVYMIVLGCLLVIFVTSRLQDSRVGRAWVAMREDETVAQAMGINTWQYKLMAFATGAAFAGLGGVLFASRNQFTGPDDHTLMVSINVLSLVIVGGMGSIPGVIMGALALKGLPEILRQLESYRLLAFGALLVGMMILRPEGLWPSQRRRREMHSEDEEPPPEEAVPPLASNTMEGGD